MLCVAEIGGKTNHFLEPILKETLGISFSKGSEKSWMHFIEPASFGLGLKPFSMKWLFTTLSAASTKMNEELSRKMTKFQFTQIHIYIYIHLEPE